MSMGRQNALEVATNELLASLEALPPETTFQVVIYNDHPAHLLPTRRDWLEPTILNKQLVAHALRCVKAVGGTSHTLALAKSLSLGAEAIYFLTDADDADPVQLRRLSRNNTNGVPIHVIELNVTRFRTRSTLEEFAKSSKGQFRMINFRKWKR
ncbi:MAG: hypothetical protein ACFCD0_04320 [Gemmataceae bacterium]